MNEQASVGILDEFQTELVRSWRQLPNKAFFFLLLAAWLALFQFWGNSTLGYLKTSSLLRWMYDVYAGWAPTPDQEDRQGLWIPLVVLALFWWKRKQLLDSPLKIWPPALLIVGAGIVCHVFGFMVQQPRVSIGALFLGIYGLTGLAWGPQWLRRSFFPFVLFIFCVPFGSIVTPLTFPLRLLVTMLTEWVAHYLLAIDVMRVGTQLFDPLGTYQYDVAAACSGIRSLLAFFLITTIYGVVAFRSPWKRLFLIALAVPFSILGNLIRMLAIIIAAQMGGQKWGMSVHDSTFISLLPYAVVIFCLLLIGRRMEDAEHLAASAEKAAS